MPNTLAYLLMITWPIISYLLLRNKSADRATILLFLVPYLALPAGLAIDLPVLPPLDKNSVAALSAALFLFLMQGKVYALPRNRAAVALLIILFVSPVMTVLTNADPLVYGPRVLPAVPALDIVSMTFFNIVLIYVPLLAGFNFLNTTKSHKTALICVAAAAFIYSLPALWEVRMSPQLQKEIFGFFPHDWRQQIRDGGFRPVIFLGHGLRVATFIALGTICAIALWKTRTGPLKQAGLLKVGYLSIVLLLCKTYSAIVYVVIALGLVAFLGKRGWLRAAALLAAFVLAFPALRSADLVPTHQISSFFASYSEDRAESLQFRFKNEQQLLARANERALFGWGGWGRQRVFNALGEDTTVIDGQWIVLYGSRGLLGYIADFGLLCLPIFAVALACRGSSSNYLSPYTAALCLILSVNLVDLLPNSSISPLTYVLAGGLLGYADRLSAKARANAAAEHDWAADEPPFK